MGELIDMEQKGCESSPFMTMTGWVDVRDSDRGDLRHRCVVNKSGSKCFQMYTLVNKHRGSCADYIVNFIVSCVLSNFI